MGLAMKKSKKHPYIFKQMGVCGGRSVIEGTRIPIWSIIKWYKVGMSVEDIIREFPQLTPSQIHDAFSFYYDNQEEVEKDILENENEKFFRNVVK
ncbi:MAG TPA: DUF433 domain-containing protein [Candidatus Wunengus sp. YC61]|uniref:DUF433 domain-containing protein n=1 Tax=Candidatus Wunengus sp. YC61 TaxID=3367698 RepID=UPI00402577DF